ncbi:hypothetical protein BC937DRAFT_92599 [Endogone sp. FLAS-F59071]|nr:hypothetical protein BC937DRAFT_92599 [Endogone sp. FLAS-F59071]|eukprot:RUS21481.1 hypothetical protein BC937DRAFT_92599 [Endogone sp. FLAS-F59071]
MSKRQLNKTKKERTKGLPKGKRVVFDEEGKVRPFVTYSLFSRKPISKFYDSRDKSIFLFDATLSSNLTPHQIYEMQNENEFLKAGDVKTQIRKFMQDEVKIMQEADAADKEVAKGKRRQKKVEKKAKAREMVCEDGGQSKTIITIGNDVYEAFSEDDKDIAMQYSDSGPEEEIVPITKVKRWFQNEDNSTSKKKRVIGIEQPQTLEDQEALALRLLGSSL